MQSPMLGGDLGAHVELPDDAPIARVGGRVGLGPVHRAALENGGRQEAEPCLSIHDPFPLPASAARAVRLCARPRDSRGLWPLPAGRTCTPIPLSVRSV